MRTALLQSSGRPGSVVENLKVLDEAAGRAAAAGAGLVAAPEMFLTGYAIGDDIARLAEPADGDSADAVAEIATRHGVAVVYGYPEREGETVYNSAQLISADGTRLANYRKTHLFGCFERDHFTPGEQPVVQADLNGLRVGLMICYDVEFPENVRAHALAGTDLLVVPTAQMHPFQFVAESVVPVRAFENQMYVAYVNRVGPEGEFEFVGLSTLAGPDGIARTRAGRGEELVLADADPDFLAASREANPYLKDRRPGLYGSLV
ncbi:MULTISPECIES: carbon-nitrogen hydrolase family protein [Streptomyces]|jgi:predicted amidohydrolase|uniref:carbon-nitrogen hydrolase family protein n=1 Tax=Streptomyces TaxID=1883 RepID=UPI0006BAF214|nr:MULTISPECIES: carbon-nitrogen hydrolase family protein [unclassified Streptomyces]KPH98683.1 Nitrilase/cyanide hydratase and apolipoprotein N-acyltransferase [Actinobacteria bacterium OK006]NMI56905.1 carbon-nitrogen hydrolase family protein [Streptomyces sp. RLA2-12]QDN56298.1 carbon-nitrogen hydrolase family protein [Streptomyces sp. S1D4-20]QDN66475.1 carbon-nitrogen hydrolase family protein [Streptomyces sp. S1D4-14]QDN76761.1 carbon-nitrogen hydrolase family protein [Streptomyces sp. S